MDEKEPLTTTAVKVKTTSGSFTVNRILEANVQAFRGGRNCPVMGLFQAGAIQRGKSETYVIQLAYDESIYEGFPKGVTPKIIDAYGLVTVKPNPPSDVCSGGQKHRTDYYDRRVPCKAHDYCYDLVRFEVAPSLSESDCDDKFHDLMNSDCADRGTLEDRCRGRIIRDLLNAPGVWTIGVRSVELGSEVHPGVVVIQNVKTGMCVDVEERSDKDGGRLIQWPCENNGQISKHRQFRFYIKRDLDGDSYFHIKPEHQPGYCVSVTDTNNVVMRISCRVITNPASFGDNLRAPSSSLFFLAEDNENNEERYTIRNSDSPNRCWSPATSDQGSHLINSSPCNRDSDLHLWEIREVEE